MVNGKNDKEGLKLLHNIQEASKDFPIIIEMSGGGVGNIQHKRLQCKIKGQPLQFKADDNSFMMKVLKYFLSDNYDKVKIVKPEIPLGLRYIDVKEEIYKNGKYQPYAERHPEYVKAHILELVRDLVKEYKEEPIDLICFNQYDKCEIKHFSLKKNPLLKMLLKKTLYVKH